MKNSFWIEITKQSLSVNLENHPCIDKLNALKYVRISSQRVELFNSKRERTEVFKPEHIICSSSSEIMIFMGTMLIHYTGVNLIFHDSAYKHSFHRVEIKLFEEKGMKIPMKIS